MLVLSDSPDRPALNKDGVSFTPEMIQAGMEVIWAMGDDLSFRDLGPWDAERLVVRVVTAVVSAAKVVSAERASAEI